MKLSKQGAGRIIAAAKRDERKSRGGGIPPRPGYPAGGQGGLLAQTGYGGVPALSGTTPGSATVTLYHFDGATLTLSSETLTAFNSTGTAVGASKIIQLKWALGAFWVDVESC